MASSSARALDGYRICDFTGQLAGAGATRWLAAFGAQVIRIEDPVNQGTLGHPPRHRAVQRRAARRRVRRGFHNHNIEKLGITLNLRDRRGKEMLARPGAHLDVVTENFAAGVLERLGFGYEQLRALAPTSSTCRTAASATPAPTRRSRRGARSSRRVAG